MRLTQTLVCATLFSYACSASAVQKCVDAKGKTVYQDAPCVDGVPVNLSGAGTPDPVAAARNRKEVADDAQKERLVLEQRKREGRVLQAIAAKQVFVGMTQDQAIQSWGKPDKVNSTVTNGGLSEQWVYDLGNFKAQYVYVSNGLVTSVQSSR